MVYPFSQGPASGASRPGARRGSQGAALRACETPEVGLVQVSPIRVEKGFEALASRLREQILRGDIPPGDILPNERELVDRSGLSRGSVREALRVLETQGLVSTRLGRNGGRVAIQPGAEVVRSSLDVLIRGQQIRFPALLETVEVLEPSLAALAALHRDDDDIAAIRRESRKLRATSHPTRFLTANARWHRAMAQASHNLILTAVYDALGPRLLDPHVSGFASAEVRNAVSHAIDRIETAIVAGDPEAARRRMERHVRAYRAQVEAVAPKIVTL